MKHLLTLPNIAMALLGSVVALEAVLLIVNVVTGHYHNMARF